MWGHLSRMSNTGVPEGPVGTPVLDKIKHRIVIFDIYHIF